MSTNIVTVRHYTDGTISLSINGREVPDLKSVQNIVLPDGGNECRVTFAAAQYNVLQGDDNPPPFISKVAAPRKRTWVQKFESWLARR